MAAAVFGDGHRAGVHINKALVGVAGRDVGMAAEHIGEITAPTLVLGGAQDHTLDPNGSRLLAEGIPNSRLHLWPDYGHAVYDEAKDFDARILDFLK